MANSTARKSAAKSPSRSKSKAKPRFPLWQHAATGQWCKKINGHRYYFGVDKDAALTEYLRVKDDREAGREPPLKDDQRLTLKTLVNTFLTHKKSAVAIGELTQRTFNDYHTTCEGLLKALGKNTAVDAIRIEDLLAYRRELAERLGPTALGSAVTRVRTVFIFAFENGLTNQPVRFGAFKRPAKPATRRMRDSKGSKLFDDPSELRKIIEAADVQLRAMIYLGLNAAYGNADCGTLPIKAIDLVNGWADFPRQKTGIDRRCPLWQETVSAIKEYLPTRRKPVDDENAGLLFVTQSGRPWPVDGRNSGPITAEFRKLLESLNLYREGLSFYALRHTLQTIADECGDYLATKRIMGHCDASISDHYRERFPDERLVKVTDHVRGWLFGEEGGAK
jgi:integrase